MKTQDYLFDAATSGLAQAQLHDGEYINSNEITRTGRSECTIRVRNTRNTPPRYFKLKLSEMR
jgi:hypothetical protein